MSTEKKVLFLFLALVILIISCVFMHIDDFKKDSDISPVVQTKNDAEADLLKTTIDKVKSFASSFSQDTEVEPLKVIEEDISSKEESKKDDIVTDKNNQTNITDSKKEENSDTSNTLTEDKKEETTTDEKVEEVVEEKIEEVLTPLISLDTRYRRSANEKLIQDLSKESQELQIRLNDYIKENPIVFKRGSNNITKNSDNSIQTVVSILEEYTNIRIEVAGHTDSAGAAKLNQKISEKRAVTVKLKLIKYGINKSRIKARGYGESIPLVKNSPKGYSKINRRVEFNIVEE